MVFNDKPPKNEAEGLFFNHMVSRKWSLTKKGWPDFFCVRDGKFICVEVKRHRGYRLKKYQRLIMDHLSRAGIPCYKWTPDGGFEEHAPAIPEL